MTDRIQKTMQFLKESLSRSPYFQREPGQESYRYQHSLRVAAYGAQIAAADGLDEEALVLGCLLHDISYRREFLTQEDWLGHGRESARIARPWLQSLGLAPQLVEELCYGIAIHVDGEADFPGEPTVLAQLIGNCDDIDRFDAYRIYDSMEMCGFGQMLPQEQIAWIEERLPRLKQYTAMEFAAPTATKLWQERVAFQVCYYERLLRQLKLPKTVLDAELSSEL